LGCQPFGFSLRRQVLMLQLLEPLAFALQIVRQSLALLLQAVPFCDLQADPEFADLRCAYLKPVRYF
jgi:hypothetical protein